MATLQQPIVVNENLPLNASNVSSQSLQFDLNQTIATEDYTDVAINPISPSSSNIVFNNFAGSISYNPYPYSIGESSTNTNLDISINAGNKINLLGYNQIDLNISGAIQTLVNKTDYTLNKTITSSSYVSGLLAAISNTPNMLEFQSVQVGNFIYMVGGLSDVTVADTTVTKTYSDACYYSYINQNGVMSELQSTSALPVGITRGYLTVLNNILFYIGGETSAGVVNTVYYAPINTDGSLGAWVTSSVTLPVAGSYIVGANVNGYIYIINLFPGPKSNTTTPLTSVDYYYTTFNTTSNDINAFTDGGISLFGAGFYYGGQTLILGNTIYVLGGMDYNGGYHSGVYSISISQTNTLSAAVDTNNNLPQYLYDFNILNINNNLYLVGGYSQNGTSGYSITPFGSSTSQTVTLNPSNYSLPIIYTAPTASDTIGPWTVYQNTLPESICRGGSYVVGNKLYVLGGINIIQNQQPTTTGNDTSYIYTPSNSVYVSNILNGVVQEFNPAQDNMPSATAQYQSIQIGNRIYCIGGYNNGVASVNIYYAFINEDDTLSQWHTSEIVLPTSIWGFSLVQIQNYLYIIGGFNGTAPVSNIYAATINSDNSLTAFVLVGTIPVPLTNAVTYIGNNTLYLIGGLGAQQASSAIYTSIINSNGTLGKWTTSTNVLPLGLRNVSSVVTNDNTLYVFGNSSTVPANNIGYSIPIGTNGALGSVNTTAITLPATTSQYLTANLINDVIYLTGNNNTAGTTFDVFTNSSSNGSLGTWNTISTNLPLGTISQTVFNVGNMLYVTGITDNVNYYSNIYSFIMDFNYSYNLSLNNALSSIPTNLYLTQYVYGNGIVASGGYLLTLTVKTQVFSQGTYTYNYNTIYNTNNGDTVYFQFNNMNKGDTIVAFRGVITGTESVPESQLTT